MENDIFNVDFSDVEAPEGIRFLKGDQCTFIIEQIKAIGAGVFIECRVVMPAEHEGKKHGIFFSSKFDKPINKQKWYQFVKAFYSPNELKTRTMQRSVLIGQKFSCVADEAREFNGKTYQDFRNYKLIPQIAITEIADGNIAF